MYKYSHIENLIKKNINPITDSEIVHVNQSAGRYLAEDIYSLINIPPTNNSAVDGYLFNFEKLKLSKTNQFTITEELHAGDKYTESSYQLKNALKVSTGAAIPKGFDTVIMDEDFLITGKNIIFKKKDISKWMNIRKKGEDIKKNKKVFTQGHFLRPQDVAMLSALGLNKVKVTRKIIVGLLSNGNELINPGKKKEDNKIYDSNRYSLFSLLNTNSIKVLDKGIVKDDYHKIKSQISDLKNNCDLIIISGGASSGSRDFIVKIIKEIGAIKFWKVSIKPGRPFGFGFFNKKKPILILPGNPVACFVIFFLFGKVLLNYIQGNFSYKKSFFIVKSNFSMKKKFGREEFLRGRTFVKNGIMYVNKFYKQGAGILNSLVWSNGLIRLRSNKKIIEKNSDLEFYPYER